VSTLAVTVVVAGKTTPGLAISIYPTTDFIRLPQRTGAAPNATPTATGVSGGTLSGLSAVDYQLLVVDARGVNNWFHVPASYVGGSYTATVPWTTPTSVTRPVSTGGDTPGGTSLASPWAQREHIHEVFIPSSLQQYILPVPPANGVISALAVAATDQWWCGGSGITIAGGSGNPLVFTPNAGNSWATFSGATLGIGSDSVWDLAASGSTVIGVSSSGLVFYSTNGGSTWTTFTSAGGAAYSCTIASGPTWLLYTAGGVYYSTNSGVSWTLATGPIGGVAAHTSIRANGGSVVCVTEDVGTGKGIVYYSATSGTSWTAATAETPTAPNTHNNGGCIFTTGSVIYVGCRDGLYYSTNSGGSWIQAYANANNVYAIATSADNLRLIFADGQSAAPSIPAYTQETPATVTDISPNPLDNGMASSAIDGNGVGGIWLFGGSVSGSGSCLAAYKGA
jgi:hypothetical protein